MQLEIVKPVRNTMKKLFVAGVTVLVALSLAGCASVGKGKAPSPIVTKG